MIFFLALSSRFVFSASNTWSSIRCVFEFILFTLLTDSDIGHFTCLWNTLGYLDASVDERQNGMAYAMNYLNDKSNPFAPVTVVAAGQKCAPFEKIW